MLILRTVGPNTRCLFVVTTRPVTLAYEKHLVFIKCTGQLATLERNGLTEYNAFKNWSTMFGSAHELGPIQEYSLANTANKTNDMVVCPVPEKS